jgi:DNA-directed RNA polymerase specialized sigma24 family protein
MNGQAMSSPTVAATVALAGAGDEAAFAQLVASYHADMARVAFAACGDRDLAADAVQAAWLVAWRGVRLAPGQPDGARGEQRRARS